MQTKHGVNSTSGGWLFWPSICYRRMPSSLRTTRTQTAPTTRRKGTRSFPGVHAADDTCPGPSIFAVFSSVTCELGCLSPTRASGGRSSDGERAKQQKPLGSQASWFPRKLLIKSTTKAAAGGEFRKNNIEVFLSLYIIYTIRFILNSKKFQKKSARPPKMGQIVKRKSHKAQMGRLVGPVPYFYCVDWWSGSVWSK